MFGIGNKSMQESAAETRLRAACGVRRAACGVRRAACGVRRAATIRERRCLVKLARRTEIRWRCGTTPTSSRIQLSLVCTNAPIRSGRFHDLDGFKQQAQQFGWLLRSPDRKWRARARTVRQRAEPAKFGAIPSRAWARKWHWIQDHAQSL